MDEKPSGSVPKLLISYGYPKFISIDKHADNNVMHGFRF